MSTDGSAQQAWITPADVNSSGFQRRVAGSINGGRYADTESVSRELAYRMLQELHAIKLILAWVLVVVPIILIVVAILIGVASHPTTAQPTGF